MAKKYGEENIEPGDNTRFLEHELEVRSWGRIDVEDETAISERLEKYFNLCKDNDMKPTVAGMAMALGVSRQSLYDWRIGKRRAKESHSEVIEYWYGVLQALYEDYMMNGKMNPVAGIFLGKNHFGYTDQRDVVVTAQQKFDTPQLEASEIRSKYLESAGEIEAEGTEIQ